LSFAFFGCKDPVDDDTIYYRIDKLEFVETTDIVQYDLLLSPDIPFREILIPVIFNYTGNTSYVNPSLIAVKGNYDANKLSTTIVGEYFSLMKEDESQDTIFNLDLDRYLIAYIYMRINLIGDARFDQQTITSFDLIVHDTAVTVPVNIKISDRRDFGVYRNLINGISKDMNETEYNVSKLTYDETIVSVNNPVKIKSIFYPDRLIIDNFRMHRMLDPFEEYFEIFVDNSLNINADFNTSYWMRARWESPQGLGNGFFGREVIIKYVLKADNKEYIDTWFTIMTYRYFLKNVIIQAEEDILSTNSFFTIKHQGELF
jgi:hypothetical protein